MQTGEDSLPYCGGHEKYGAITRNKSRVFYAVASASALAGSGADEDRDDGNSSRYYFHLLIGSHLIIRMNSSFDLDYMPTLL